VPFKPSYVVTVANETGVYGILHDLNKRLLEGTVPASDFLAG